MSFCGDFAKKKAMLQKQENFGPIISNQEVNKCLNPVYTLKDSPFGSKKLKAE